MLRKNRFGSKAGRDASRDSEQDAKDDPDGSNSSSDDAEGAGAEEVVDRYERSSDRYRAASSERAGAEGSAPARRSFGNSFSKSSGAAGDKTSSGFKGSSFSSSKGSGSSFGRKSSFGKSGSGSSLSTGTSKAEAIAASADVDKNALPEEAEPVYERSSDRAFPKKRSSFGGGGLGRSSAKASTAEPDDVYERSSDKKFGRGSSSGRKSSFGGKAAAKPADGEDVFERSTERATGRRSAFAKKPTEDKLATGSPGLAKQQTDANAADLSDRLKLARALLEQAVVQTQAASAKTAATGSNSAAIAGEFEPADPYEPFEQCVPATSNTPTAQNQSTENESVYSRGTTGRGKPPTASESKSKRPQLSLRGRALGYLSRREHSRAELSRKLTPHLTETDSLETLLDALEREGWLSNERFVDSVVHRRGAKLGTSRIVNELKRNGIDETLIHDANAALKDTELARARDVWSKKYGELPITPADRAKQARFLATRGFTSGVIVKVLKASDDDFNIE